MNQIIKWISKWFDSHCDGSWEHDNQIKIGTLDNPGWFIKINVTNTKLEHLDIEQDIVEHIENEWFVYKLKEGQFIGYGDINKLELLLEKFKELVEANLQISGTD